MTKDSKYTANGIGNKKRNTKKGKIMKKRTQKKRNHDEYQSFNKDIFFPLLSKINLVVYNYE